MSNVATMEPGILLLELTQRYDIFDGLLIRLYFSPWDYHDYARRLFAVFSRNRERSVVQIYHEAKGHCHERGFSVQLRSRL